MSGLSPLHPRERAWLQSKAARAGSTTQALCRLVRMGLLYEAVCGDLLEQQRLEARLRAQGLSATVVRRRVQAWLRRRHSWRLRDHFHNLVTWDRPGGEHFYGRAPAADPDHRWTRGVSRALIAAGREVFAEWP